MHEAPSYITRYGRVIWTLRRNFYSSVVICGDQGSAFRKQRASASAIGALAGVAKSDADLRQVAAGRHLLQHWTQRLDFPFLPMRRRCARRGACGLQAADELRAFGDGRWAFGDWRQQRCVRIGGGKYLGTGRSVDGG